MYDEDERWDAAWEFIDEDTRWEQDTDHVFDRYTDMEDYA